MENSYQSILKHILYYTAIQDYTKADSIFILYMLEYLQGLFHCATWGQLKVV